MQLVEAIDSNRQNQEAVGKYDKVIFLGAAPRFFSLQNTWLQLQGDTFWGLLTLSENSFWLKKSSQLLFVLTSRFQEKALIIMLESFLKTA